MALLFPLVLSLICNGYSELHPFLWFCSVLWRNLVGLKAPNEAQNHPELENVLDAELAVLR